MSEPAFQDSRHLDRTFAGGLAWSAGIKYLTQIVTWSALVATARLLTPAEFGISEMAAVFVVISGTLAEFGIGGAVLQMQEIQDNRLYQMHTFSCVTGALALGCFLLAIPLMTSFFNLPGLGWLFAANGVTFVITGFQAVPNALLQRDLDYRRISLAEALLVLVQALVTVACAWGGWGYWSLTTGAVTGKLCAVALLNYWKPLPWVWIRWHEIRAAVQMGGQVAIGRLAWSAYIQSDGIVVGRMLGDSSLGVYRMAMSLAAAPAEKTSSLIMRAASPLFAKVQKDLVLVRRYFLILTEVLLLVIMPLMLGLTVVAQEAVATVLEPKWLPAVAPLQWLAIFMTLRPLESLAEQVLISQRHTRFTMNMSILGFVVMPVGFVLGAWWKGPPGVAAMWLILMPITILPILWRLLRVIELRVGELLAASWPAVTASITMFLAVGGVRQWFLQQGWATPWVLAAEVGVGAIVYAAVLLGFFRHRLERFYRFFTELRRNKAGVETGAVASPRDTSRTNRGSRG